MSVSQALAEIKLVRNRIQQAITTINLIALKRSPTTDTHQYMLQASASYQNYQDLVERYARLNTAIHLHNARTMVELNGRTCTVTEVIERRKVLAFEKDMTRMLENQYGMVETRYDAHLQAGLIRSKSPDVNIQYNQIHMEVMDPLNIRNLIANRQNQIEEFETQTEWLLQESNSTSKLL